MATITIKNIPDDLYENLKKLADMNRRSINSEVIMCIEKAVRSRPVDPEQVIARARLLREKSAGYRISDEELTEAKQAGRP